MENKSSEFSQVLDKGINLIGELMGSATEQGPADIVSVIEEDHKPLKEFIKIMKDADRPLAERMQAFKEFAPLLMTHAKSEEKSLYDYMKHKPEFREYAFEGDTEHGVADQLLEETKRATDKDDMGAKIKVLAEMVEHHIQEEENDILPEVKSKLSQNELIQLSRKYTEVQAEIIADGQDDSPHESDLSPTDLRQ